MVRLGRDGAGGRCFAVPRRARIGHARRGGRCGVRGGVRAAGPPADVRSGSSRQWWPACHAGVARPIGPTSARHGRVVVVAVVPLLGRDTADGFRRAGLGVFGVVWLAALTGLVLLGPAALPLFFAVSVADVAAFCGGRLLGGPRLSPMSPEKRWSGVLIGGLAGSARSPCSRVTPALAVAVVVGAPLGDLVSRWSNAVLGSRTPATGFPASGAAGSGRLVAGGAGLRGGALMTAPLSASRFAGVYGATRAAERLGAGVPLSSKADIASNSGSSRAA